ncbi:MAG: acyl carrier protein [Planctomycetes bacterium]|nr:acyl carrier protein [Planctomycetota bacterium]
MNDDAGLDEALRRIFQRVFEMLPQSITDDTRRGQSERWDSLGHLELLEALSQEFKIEIPPEEALQMDTFAAVRQTVRQLRSQ